MAVGSFERKRYDRTVSLDYDIFATDSCHEIFRSTIDQNTNNFWILRIFEVFTYKSLSKRMLEFLRLYFQF